MRLLSRWATTNHITSREEEIEGPDLLGRDDGLGGRGFPSYER
jgi:hypothetical protein